jgi:hypothetical protein
MNRPAPLELARWALLMAPVAIFVLLGNLFAMPIAVAAALVAYDGPFKKSGAVMIAVLIVLEFLLSMQPGVFSLPFIVTIALLRLTSSLVALPTPTTSVSWSVGTLLRTIAVACVAVTLCSVGAALMQSWVYDGGYTVVRIRAALEPWLMLQTCTLAAALVAVLYRIDVPFSRRAM